MFGQASQLVEYEWGKRGAEEDVPLTLHEHEQTDGIAVLYCELGVEEEKSGQCVEEKDKLNTLDWQ